MKNIYDNTTIPQILKTFNVKNIVISGINDKELLDIIFSYDASFTHINTNIDECIEGNPLDILPDLESYDAIFINDDPNWFTVYNELNIIKKNNPKFPLVFICNNIFPNKRRDSYLNPDKIPLEFRNDYTNKLTICHDNDKINISDGFFHARDINTPKNGVLTAIEDFLKENHHIGLLKINFIKEISILYLKLQVNQKRISIINKKISNAEINDISFSDKLIENQMLVSYINKLELYNDNLIDFECEISKKNAIINDYENKIQFQNKELDYKDTRINGIVSNLNLKDSQIKNIESKLINRDKRINTLENQLKIANKKVYSLNQETADNDDKISSLEDQIRTTNDELMSLTIQLNEFKQNEYNYHDQINSLNNLINQKDEDLKNKLFQIQIKDEQINSLKNEFSRKEKLFKDKENLFRDKENKLNYQIDVNNENIIQMNNQINSLKKDLAQKDISFRNKKNELDIKLNDSADYINHKNNQIKIQQKELDKNKQKINNLEQLYTAQLSKIDSNEYYMHGFKEEISNNYLEINYLKNNTLTKKIFSPLSYVYLIIKSNPKDINLNIKLYRALKDSKCFDIGFYLNNNKDLIECNFCKYFSAELHYVCHGFDEDRRFNKKYFQRNSKKALLNYLLKCDE